MDWLDRSVGSGRLTHHGPPFTIQTLLIALIKAYEVQGCFLLRNAFNGVGLDHTILVKLASTAVVSWILGLSEEQCMAAISHVWMDSSPLRVYRSGSNTIPRKGWAAGDACMRAVQFAILVQRGQPGALSALTQPRWGFYDSMWRGGGPFVMPMPYRTWAVENVLYKVMPVEGHAMAAVEAVLVQRQRLLEKLQSYSMTPAECLQHIGKIKIRTCAAAKLIIDKTGTLRNAADRDHCMQYVIAVALLKGANPDHSDYADSSPYAASPIVDALRMKMEIIADDLLTKDYMDLSKRSVPSGVMIHLTDGHKLSEVLVEFPSGHPQNVRTSDIVRHKFRKNMGLMFSTQEIEQIECMVEQAGDTSISEFVDLMARTCSSRL